MQIGKISAAFLCGQVYLHDLSNLRIRISIHLVTELPWLYSTAIAAGRKGTRPPVILFTELFSSTSDSFPKKEHVFELS